MMRSRLLAFAPFICLSGLIASAPSIAAEPEPGQQARGRKATAPRVQSIPEPIQLTGAAPQAARDRGRSSKPAGTTAKPAAAAASAKPVAAGAKRAVAASKPAEARAKPPEVASDAWATMSDPAPVASIGPARTSIPSQMYTGGAPVYAAAPVIAPEAGFGGCYAGLHGGGVLNSATIRNPEAALSDFPQQTLNTQGLLAGAQVGCNLVSGKMLVGVEAEASLPISATGQDLKFRNSYSPLKNEFGGKERPMMGAALRAGFIQDQALIYGKAGIVYTSTTYNNHFESATLNPKNGTTYDDGVTVSDGKEWFSAYESNSSAARLARFGMLLGVGIEYAIDPKWTLKGEYNFIYSGQAEATFNQTGTGRFYTRSMTNGAVTESTTSGIVRTKAVDSMRNLLKVGVNRRF